jgi:hypothetical protein
MAGKIGGRENVVIKLGFCVAYDWLLLKKSVPLVYDWADTICFSLDKNRRSWSGTPFAFEENEFYEWVQHIDKDKKIKIYEDAFYREGFTSIENDNYQRTKMAEQMGRGGWHVQIDSDEYFLDFEGFKNYLFSVIENPGCSWINLIKRTDTGYLYVYHPTHNNSWMPFATNKPEYLEARRNSHFNHFSPFVVLHETWARGEAELWQKMNSWGHDQDFASKESYFNLWKALDEHNYNYIKDFHPLQPDSWNKLQFVPRTEISEVVEWLRKNADLQIDKVFLQKKNSRVWQKVNQVFGKK